MPTLHRLIFSVQVFLYPQGFLWLQGCHHHTWNSVEDCLSLSKGTARDECLSEHVVDLFRTDPTAAKKQLPDLVQDPIILDYLWLKVTREYNPATRDYCMLTQDRILKQRCLTLVQRPHLYRER